MINSIVEIYDCELVIFKLKTMLQSGDIKSDNEEMKRIVIQVAKKRKHLKKRLGVKLPLNELSSFG